MIALRSRTAGFTLTELVVAVGLVTVLTLAIGRLFSSVTRLTGTGTAIAETDDLARTLEALLREDFESFNRLREDETFLVISNREIGGDQNLSTAGLQGASLAQGERVLYLNREDQIADERAGFVPYETGRDSRAVTSRIDKLAFIGLGNYVSYQQDDTGDAPIAANHALIIYGHGLRPTEDVDFDPEDTNDYRRRQFRADADPETDRYGEAFGVEFSRNQFAGDFMLARQQLLLVGGLAAGYPAGSNREPPIGSDREYMPYVRDHEADFLGYNERDFGIDRDDVTGGNDDAVFPNPRLNAMGRSDIVAQDLDDVLRWLLGEQDRPFNASGSYTQPYVSAFAPNGFVPADATAFSVGQFDDSRRNLEPGDADFRLWRRRAGGIFGTGLSKREAYVRNVRNQQSAIAGTLSRILIEPEPYSARGSDPTGISQPADRRMDLHALLAERCSSFEVAWSDGSTWLFDETARVDTDGVYAAGDPSTLERVLKRGDLIWFDMNFTQEDLWELVSGDLRPNVAVPDSRPFLAPNADFNDDSGEFATRTLAFARRLYPVSPEAPGPEIGDRFGVPSTLPLYEPDSDNELTVPIVSPPTAGREDRLVGFRGVFEGSFMDPDDEFAEYNAALTGGALPDQGDEYFAIFGLRVPNGFNANLAPPGTIEDIYVGSWPKPRFIRIRATLHDRQFRIPGGRTYEFVFSLSPLSGG